MNYLIDIIIFYFGCLIGSFLNVVILRLPQEHTLSGRSHCPGCGHTLSAFELFPLLSYLFLMGRCRHCKKAISPRYFIIESITGALFLLGWLLLAPAGVVPWVLFVKWLIVIVVCLPIFVIDLEHYFIPDSLIFSFLPVMLLLSFILDKLGHHAVLSWSGMLSGSVLGALVGAAPFFVIWLLSKGKWMGFGDVKLMLLLGAAVGFPLVLPLIMLAVLSGGLVSAGLLIFTKKTLQSQIPFGTFLTFATLVTLLWGEQVLRWYLGILGF